jgi:hypothetical protein
MKSWKGLYRINPNKGLCVWTLIGLPCRLNRVRHVGRQKMHHFDDMMSSTCLAAYNKWGMDKDSQAFKSYFTIKGRHAPCCENLELMVHSFVMAMVFPLHAMWFYEFIKRFVRRAACRHTSVSTTADTPPVNSLQQNSQCSI